MNALRLLLTLLTILCGTTIAGAAMQETQAGVVFEKVCVLEAETHFSPDFDAPKTIPIKTPWGDAVQSTNAAALAARQQVTEGATLYRIGTTGKSAAGEAQFWALESPLTPGFAQRYGIPAENVLKADFIETATLRPGTSFITRPAPGVGKNLGGGIEVVVPEGGIRLNSFNISPGGF